MAATVGILIGIVLGFSAGFLGGWVDDAVRLVSDVTLTIPALMVLIVLQSVLDRVEMTTMAILIAAFAWPRHQADTLPGVEYAGKRLCADGAALRRIQLRFDVQGDAAQPDPIYLCQFHCRCYGSYFDGGWPGNPGAWTNPRLDTRAAPSMMPTSARRCRSICGGGGVCRQYCYHYVHRAAANQSGL
jgi:hypothetical protein